MSSVFEKDLEWFKVERNFTWVAANFARFITDIEESDVVGQEFKKLPCVVTHQRQTNCHLAFFRKVHTILVNAGCMELKLTNDFTPP